MRVTVDFGARTFVSEAVEVPSSTEGYWFALHDWQFPPFQLRYIAPQMSGTPQVQRVGDIENPQNGHYTRLTKEWQWFWFDLACKAVFGVYHQSLSKEDFNWLSQRWTAVGSSDKAFNNKQGLDDYHNYVRDERRDKKDPAIYSLICGGAALRGVRVENSRGEWMIRLESFDGTKPPPPVESIDLARDPRIFFANNISRTRIRDGYRVFRFSQFSKPEINMYRDVPVPLITSKPVYYYAERMRWVEGRNKPSPYFT